MRRIRKLTAPGKGPPPQKSQTTITVEQSHARQIRELPTKRYEFVIRSVKEGIPVGRIANHFASQGWLTVQEKTFVQYLTAFKRLHANEIDAFETDSIEDIVEGHGPELDEEQVLQQLVRLQKRRLQIGHKFEKDTNLLNPNLHKEIAATADVLEKLAKIRGNIATGAGRPSKDEITINPETKNSLSGIDRTEHAQQKLIGLFGKLGELVRSKQGDNEE